jgi:hypothetical protein
MLLNRLLPAFKVDVLFLQLSAGMPMNRHAVHESPKYQETRDFE